MLYTDLNDTPSTRYEEIGLKVGLEIHQQLLTDKKLFCRCPAGIYSHDWDAEILRHMRPTLSELGEYDGTALMEFKTKKQIVYRLNKDTVCTYEFDDTPPFEIHEEALDIALEFALLLKLNLVAELHIARKQYLDGSIPTGFQRTTILGVDGRIPYKDRSIGIQQLGLEEDSCREVSDEGHVRTYLTDRLGMPLIETVTKAEIGTPADAAGVAQVIRWLARSTRKVRTGPGAARQDVNVSVRGGRRCEIKGVSSIKRIPGLVHNEALRQVALLEIRDELKRRGVTERTFDWTAADITNRIGNTRFWPIRQAVNEGRQVHCVLLRHFDGILEHAIGPGRDFLQEFSDRVRVIACIDLLPNVISTDRPEGNLSPDEWRTVRSTVSASPDDAVIVVWGKEKDAQTACEEIGLRAREACDGVISETRQALPDGTTGFERILPGPDRMYPDTDLPPRRLTDERLAAIQTRLPEPPWNRENRYLSMGVPAQLAQRLSISPNAPLFDSVAKYARSHLVFAAGLFTDRYREYDRRGLNPARLSDSFLVDVFHYLEQGQIVREGLTQVVEHALATGLTSVEEILDTLGLTLANEDEVAASVKAALQEQKGHVFKSVNAAWRFTMGRAMDPLRGRIEGASVSRLVERRISFEVAV
jgi:glutamyl-tRNA(Gln) amidotransferase subunit E